MKSIHFYFSDVVMTVGIMAVGVLSASAQTTLYSNTANDLATRFNTETSEVGNQVILAGGLPAKITSFSFEYWGVNFSGGEQAQVRFYANDGVNWDSTFKMPGSLLFDSTPFAVSATSKSLLIFDTDFGSGLLVPNSFTWTVQFSGLGGGATAGVDLFSPPTVGNTLTSYWINNGSSWGLRTSTNSMNINFGAEFAGTSVPEPGVYALSGLGLALMFWFRSKRR
ncbi:MAG: PEP-CTERM sorting domain-containing protein [Verrucomicrobiota bacterium]